MAAGVGAAEVGGLQDLGGGEAEVVERQVDGHAVGLSGSRTAVNPRLRVLIVEFRRVKQEQKLAAETKGRASGQVGGWKTTSTVGRQARRPRAQNGLGIRSSTEPDDGWNLYPRTRHAQREHGRREREPLHSGLRPFCLLILVDQLSRKGDALLR
jgi:hypothetical protein